MRRSFRRSGGRPVRPTTWCCMSDSLTITEIDAAAGVTNVQTICDWTTIRQETGANPTLLRLRGLAQFYARGTFTTGAAHVMGVAAGLIIQNDMNGTPAGVDPHLNPEADWLWWRSLAVGVPLFGVYSTGGTLQGAQNAAMGHISAWNELVDSKAMRRLEPGDRVSLCMRGFAASDSEIRVGVGVQVRALIKQ